MEDVKKETDLKPVVITLDIMLPQKHTKEYMKYIFGETIECCGGKILDFKFDSVQNSGEASGNVSPSSDENPK